MSDNMSLVYTIKEKCVLCYACIRACPVRAIKVENDYAKIIDNRCIGCGSCIQVCGPGAIEYRESKEAVKHLLQSEKLSAAIVDPAISGEFQDITDYRLFVGMLKAMGFDYVHEMSFGVDLIAKKYKELLGDFHGKYFMSSNCPVTIRYIEKFAPDLIDNLAPMLTPAKAMAKVVRKIHGRDTKIVYITPCIEAKDDVRQGYGDVKIDSAITFTELRALFNEYALSEHAVEYTEFDPPLGASGAIFPVFNGMCEAAGLDTSLLSGNVTPVEEKENFLKSIKEFGQSNELKQHFDIYYCHGCMMGPGTSANGNKYMRKTLVSAYVNKRVASLDKEEWEKNISKYGDLDFKRRFKNDDQRLPYPSEDQIQKVLKALGKGDKKEQVACGACGYRSCREFSIAISQGLANFDMCHTFTIQKMNRYINKLNATNEKLSKTQAALKESEQLAKKEHQAAREASDVISSMMQKLRAGVVIVDQNLRIIESNNAFIKMLGSEAELISETIPNLVGADIKTLVPFHKHFSTVIMTGEDMLNRDVYLGKDLFNISVFTIRKNKVVGGIIRDLYAPEVRKDEVIRRAKAVIRENLETVQQIAFLLGESSSKTEKLLTSIIQTHNPDNK